MKVLVLNGSPKAERSNTLNITKAFLKGFPADTEVEQVNLYKKDIKPCLFPALFLRNAVPDEGDNGPLPAVHAAVYGKSCRGQERKLPRAAR